MGHHLIICIRARKCPDAFVVWPMKNFLTVCLLTLFVAASCSREQSLSVLNEVGSYINEHPEAALAALDSLSSTGEIRGKEANNAKNNIDVGILYLSMAYLYMDIFDYETAL